MRKDKSNCLSGKQLLNSRKLKSIDCCEWCCVTVCVAMLDENNQPFKQLFCFCDMLDLMGLRRYDYKQLEKIEQLLKIELTNKSINDKNCSEHVRQVLEITLEDSIKDSPRCVKPTQVCQYYTGYYD